MTAVEASDVGLEVIEPVTEAVNLVADLVEPVIDLIEPAIDVIELAVDVVEPLVQMLFEAVEGREPDGDEGRTVPSTIATALHSPKPKMLTCPVAVIAAFDATV